ncbi:uncharacterized protein LAESUDRAFT_721389 [Laetiporus sulphureus 93-53]|uniref:Uncharacterized protein n=1 Tax=Laetiporus sulphureus 93-53 TaxID=1314785 RepID=A0A165GXQ6_9APHY|nr:uncharacterized protein LAESUDRAFT_721389 [Laetiporus sulphureus 93-53]KZT10971.1 hypothetical protein LAESUDRAFT_721389 [Laetiporus sulphureus 93-53]
MGQYWCLINLDKRAAISGLGKLGEWLFGGTPEHFVPFLAVTLPPSAFDVKKQSVIIAGPSLDASSALGSLNLAHEILYLIFGEIDDLRDAISLSLTNKTLSDIGEARVYELVCKVTAPWSGDRIICAGDYMQWDDLPEGILSKSELREYRGRDEDEDDADLNEEDDSDADGPTSLYDVRWQEPDVLKFGSVRGWELPQGLSSFERKEFSRRSKPRYSIDISKDETHGWVLCNISKREYVRASAVAALTGTSAKRPQGIGGPGRRKIGLGHVLITQICWSSDNSISMYYEGDLHRGRWAGDHLSITTMDRLDKHEAWKDASEEVVKKVVEIWDSEFEGWRSQVDGKDSK